MHALVNGARIHYELFGCDASAAASHDRLTLLLIHGFPLSGRMWIPVAELLQDDFCMIVPDLRGFGESELAGSRHTGASEPISIAGYADDLALLLDHLGVNKPIVPVGLSMGGYIALEFCRRYAARVLALVLADTRADADPAPARQQRRETAKRVLREGSGFLAEEMAGKLFAEWAPAKLRHAWRMEMAGAPAQGVAAALHAMAGRADSTALLKSIVCPTLVVVGEDDSITPPEVARKMAASLLISRLAVIPNAGHLTPIEQPEAFSQALRGFAREFAPLTSV